VPEPEVFDVDDDPPPPQAARPRLARLARLRRTRIFGACLRVGIVAPLCVTQVELAKDASSYAHGSASVKV
jgi:hypothetical protein